MAGSSPPEFIPRNSIRHLPSDDEEGGVTTPDKLPVTPASSPPGPAPRQHISDTRASDIQHRGNGGASRPGGRVTFTVGGSDSEGTDVDSDEEKLPHHHHEQQQQQQQRQRDQNVNFPQRPPPSHCPSNVLHRGVTELEEAPSLEAGDLSTRRGTQAWVETPIARVSSRRKSDDESGEDGAAKVKDNAIHSAYERAQQLASRIRRPSYYLNSSEKQLDTPPTPSPSPPLSEATLYDEDEIPLEKLRSKGINTSRHAHGDEDEATGREEPTRGRRRKSIHAVRGLVDRLRDKELPRRHSKTVGRTELPGDVSPCEDRGGVEADDHRRQDHHHHHHGGVLSSLLKLYERRKEDNAPLKRVGQSWASFTSALSHSAESSGISTPRTPSRSKPRWYDKQENNRSATNLSGMSSPSGISSPTGFLGDRFGMKRSRSATGLANKQRDNNHRRGLEDEIRITVHIAEILSRHRYLLKLCQALMLYGAPTHRLEEYMRSSARVLDIDAQFLYIPGCMIVAFDDSSTHTTEVKLVKVPQGVNLGRLADVHEIYKEVVHDVIGVEEAMQRLEEIIHKSPKYRSIWMVLLSGCASAMVGPFAFGSRPIDMPIAFLLGCILGLLQYIVSPRSAMYQNVFEVSVTVLTSFLARAFGSIRHGDGGYLFCFSGLAQSSITLILPGYTVLCSSLELQSRNLVAGSVRMVYAIIYSLFIGFGMMLGTSIYGLMDKNASCDYKCPDWPIDNEYLQRFPFVILFTICLTMLNQAKWRQTPLMVVIAFTGYVVNYSSSKRIKWNVQIANALGAFVIGVLGNLYSRLRHGVAAAAMLPAIFVQVPSGLAATGSLVAGLAAADKNLHHNSTSNATGMGGTEAAAAGGRYDLNETKISALSDNRDILSDEMGTNKIYGNMVFDVGYAMVQVAIGVTVGLFLAALVVYPFGKRRSGLFSF